MEKFYAKVLKIQAIKGGFLSIHEVGDVVEDAIKSHPLMTKALEPMV